MKQLNGSKLGKGYDKAVCCQPTYLTHLKSVSCEMVSWMNHQLESRLPGETSITSDTKMMPLLTSESEEEVKSFLMMVNEQSERAGLNSTFKKLNKIMVSSPITSWQIEGQKVETLTDLIFLGSKITVDSNCSHEIKR